ncbi:MAG: hypothetical protein IKU43_09010 [Clostridia bacterium]|nr:hypothetical protein [Clostridia bacterium]
MGKLILNDEEKVLAARAEDLLQRCRQNSVPVFTEFLSDREKQIITEKAAEIGALDSLTVFGGYEDAERTVAGFFPEYYAYLEKEELYAEFPITALKIQCSGFREHNHRDYLGSILGLGIERFVIGDIIVGDNGYEATVFVHKRIVGFITENLRLIGRDGIKITECPQGNALEIKRSFELITGTVASFRIDALISEVLNLSRDKSVKLTEAGLVSINHAVVTEKSEEVLQGDVFTVRGYGKYRLSNIGDTNRKGRIRFEVQKYI